MKQLALTAVAALGIGGILVAGCRQPAPAHAQAPAASAASTFESEFPTSAGGAAQAHFVRGVTLMHLFMYQDAAKAFQAAQQAAPDFAMAYWGEALTHYQPIWRQFEPEPARAVMQRFGATPEARLAKAPTAREKDYVATLDVLYGDGPAPERLRAYADAMEVLVRRYPDDDEALAMWAVSRVVQYERTMEDMQERMRTAGIAQEVLRRRPGHLGAARYFIQSVDDPIHADLGVIAAQMFIDAKPDSPEARHVATHISAQLGRWKEMSELNWQAFELSMDWSKRHGIKLQDLNDHDYGHLLTYAQYGYLQQGDSARAGQLIDRARADFEASGKAPEIARAFGNLLAQYIVDTGDPGRLRELEALVDGQRLSAPNLEFAIGIAKARAGDLARARRAVAAITAKTTNASIMRAGLNALIAAREKPADRTALAQLREAAARDMAQIYTHFGPASPAKPPHELLGELLLDQQKGAEALAAFQESLRIYRGRSWSLHGASRAAAMTGNRALADAYAAQIDAGWRARIAEGGTR